MTTILALLRRGFVALAPILLSALGSVDWRTVLWRGVDAFVGCGVAWLLMPSAFAPLLLACCLVVAANLLLTTGADLFARWRNT